MIYLLPHIDALYHKANKVSSVFSIKKIEAKWTSIFLVVLPDSNRNSVGTF